MPLPTIARRAGRVAVAGAVTLPLVAVPALAADAAAAGPSGVNAKSAILFDSGTRKVKWGRAVDTKRPIGSITKLMTAVVVVRAGGLDRKITVKQKYIDYAVRHGGSMAKLRAGDKLTARQLLNGLLLPSGCDAAYALADVYGPGWRGFVAKMNKAAAALKMTRTHYANFDGLPWPSDTATYSTARDLTRLGYYAMTKADIRAVVARRTYTLPSGGGHHAYSWLTTNRLIGSYKGAIGVKTGHTNASGYSLLFSAKRGSKTYLGVVLNSSTTSEAARFTDAAKVLNWGFGVKAAAAYTPPAVVSGANVD
ncbi:D-alanyl-D-alanine carboxypeptidase family protein [Actinomadura parmotrematis]|uniref:D-alanyl-D-alanine carboxypeptidase n=1 Tax=Actinomadura parmotrematis TaxID=2864039 RepID=A0ABS7FKR2_9ACTN|nr:D-alanyl-D-alanine carboxypeptidase [Actinomadura parmotrematis]MBW8480944.1 D-alanyl-D-alanine carboxypeptidase [Actinomadura parmotrematis]